MTAPNPKEALDYLEAAANWMQRYLDTYGELGDDATQANIDDWHDAVKQGLATLSPPAGGRREAIARTLWETHDGAKRYPWSEMIPYDRECYYKYADAIIASGLVQDEAGWRDISTAPKDMTEIIVLCGPKDVRLGWYFAPSSTTFGWFDQHQKPIKPTKWMPFPPIRSARDGGAES